MRLFSVLLISVLAAVAVAEDKPRSAKADLDKSVELLKAKKFKEYIETYMVRSELDAIPDEDREEMYKRFAENGAPRILQIAANIGDSKPQYFERDGVKVAFFRIDPPVMNTPGILMFLEGDRWKFKNSSRVSEAKYRELVKDRLIIADDPAKKPGNDKDAALLNNLGKSLVAAFKAEDFAKCADLWLTYKRAREEMTNNAPEGAPVPQTEEQWAAIKEYIANRDKENAKKFPEMIATLKKDGFDVASAEFVETEAKVVVKFGKKTATTVYVRMKDSAGKTARITVDDAVAIDGKWLFSDKLMNVEVSK